MQQNHEIEVETEEIDQAAEVEAKVFEYVMAFEKLADTVHGLSRFFRENEGYFLQRAGIERLSIPAQEFISYVMKGSPSRQPIFMLESVLREYTKTGGDEFGNLDLFKNPILAVEMELAHKVECEQWEEERTALLNRIKELEDTDADQPEETDQPETESVEESVKDELSLDQPEEESKPIEKEPERSFGNGRQRNEKGQFIN